MLHLDKALPHDFEVTNEVESLDFSFLLVLSGTQLHVVSILTSKTQACELIPIGTIIKTLDFGPVLLQQLGK